MSDSKKIIIQVQATNRRQKYHVRFLNEDHTVRNTGHAFDNAGETSLYVRGIQDGFSTARIPYETLLDMSIGELNEYTMSDDDDDGSYGHASDREDFHAD